MCACLEFIQEVNASTPGCQANLDVVNVFLIKLELNIGILRIGIRLIDDG